MRRWWGPIVQKFGVTPTLNLEFPSEPLHGRYSGMMRPMKSEYHLAVVDGLGVPIAEGWGRTPLMACFDAVWKADWDGMTATAEKLPVKRLYRAQMLARTGDMV